MGKQKEMLSKQDLQRALGLKGWVECFPKAHFAGNFSGGGVNDSSEDARGLTRLAKPLKAHINLIPVNPVRERGYEHPDRTHVLAFKKELDDLVEEIKRNR